MATLQERRFFWRQALREAVDLKAEADRRIRIAQENIIRLNQQIINQQIERIEREKER